MSDSDNDNDNGDSVHQDMYQAVRQLAETMLGLQLVANAVAAEMRAANPAMVEAVKNRIEAIDLPSDAVAAAAKRNALMTLGF